MMTPTALYKEYSQEDKKALKALQAEVAEKLGREVKLGEILAAVEPELATPQDLVGL